MNHVYSLHSPSGNEGMPMYYCEKNQGKLQRKAPLQSTRLTAQVTSKNVFLVKTAGLCVSSATNEDGSSDEMTKSTFKKHPDSVLVPST